MGLLPDTVIGELVRPGTVSGADDRVALVTPFALPGEIAVPWLNRRAESAAGGARCPMCGLPAGTGSTAAWSLAVHASRTAQGWMMSWPSSTVRGRGIRPGRDLVHPRVAVV